jgi:cytochrome c
MTFKNNYRLMKFKIIFAVIALCFLSCSKKEVSENSSTETEASELPTVNKTVTDPAAEGQSLIEGSDCLGCHKVDEKMIGPSYKEVAAKYDNTPENVEKLADQIIKGSSGVWGDVPMPAHGFSKENAKYMATYILSLK